MAKTRGAHSFRLWVRQGPTPLAAGPPATDPSTVGPSVAAGPFSVGPSAAAAGASPSVPAVRPLLPLLTLPHLLYRAPLLLVMLRVPPLWPLPRGDIILGLGPLHPRLRIPSQPGGPHRPRGPEHQAQGSRLLRDPGCHHLHLIRVLPEPQIYLQHPSSGDLTSHTTPSQGMLAAGREISMERFTTISRHFPRTRGSESPCPSCSDTIWSHSWCRVSSFILG